MTFITFYLRYDTETLISSVLCNHHQGLNMNYTCTLLFILWNY